MVLRHFFPPLGVPVLSAVAVLAVLAAATVLVLAAVAVRHRSQAS